MFDMILVLIIFVFAIIGFIRGFTKELICFLGFALVLVLSFILKNPLSSILYKYLPFFKLNGVFKGTTSINIIIYEVISFFIVLSILLIILRIIIFASSIFEKLLKMTIILGVPSKILGFILGIIEGISWVFIILYITALPIFNIKEVKKSKIKDEVLKNTPVLSNMTKDSINAFNEIDSLIDEYKSNKKLSNKEFDYKSIDILLKYKIISIDNIKELSEKNKIKVDISSLINKYQNNN